MTLHKSKGDEFEYVFLPEMSEKSLSIDVNQAKLKASSIFMEDVKGFNPKYKKKTEELKELFHQFYHLYILAILLTLN